MPIINGTASWYSLCNGINGACAPGYPCSNLAPHAAWSYLFSNFSCGTSPQRGCDSAITVFGFCKVKSVIGRIRDACPCSTQAGCSNSTKCNGASDTTTGYRYPLADLTQAYMMSVNGNLTDGRIKVQITV